MHGCLADEAVLRPGEPKDRREQTLATESAEAVQRAVAAAVREQARALGVKSTAVSGGRPLAIVNQQLLSVGDQINGFEITAIRSREVEFRKDGVTVAVKMPDDLRGQ